MTEDRKDVKKMKYEEPKLVKLAGNTGAGDCTVGSGDSGACSPGNTAGGGCYAGNAATGGWCGTGSGA